MDFPDGVVSVAALMNTSARLRARDHQGQPMPRFAANLGYLFTERPLLERIDAAATAGFKAIELQFPYDVPASAVKTAIERNKLTILGLNTPPGERDGEFGLAAVPGREKDWQSLFTRSLEYASTIGASAIHCLAGKVASEQRPAELFPESCRTRGGPCWQDREGKHPHAVRFLSRSNRGWRPDLSSRKIPARHRTSAMRCGALTPRAR